MGGASQAETGPREEGKPALARCGLRARAVLAGNTETTRQRNEPGAARALPRVGPRTSRAAKASPARLCDTRGVYDWRTYEQAMTDLSRLPADERLQALINEWSTETQSLSDDELRKLFVFVWPDGRESADDTSEVLLRMLQSMAPVRDSETYLSGALSIFRAAAGDNGIRWTLDEAAATAKAAGRDTNLFSATVAAEDVLGHFTNDGGKRGPCCPGGPRLGQAHTRHAHGS